MVRGFLEKPVNLMFIGDVGARRTDSRNGVGDLRQVGLRDVTKVDRRSLS